MVRPRHQLRLERMRHSWPMENPGTRLWLPPLGLAGCVRAAMLRDTRGRALEAAQLDNYFPAGPLVKLSWWFSGDSMWVTQPGFSVSPPGYRVEPLLLSGPFTLPAHTRNTGPVHMLMLMFPPDAFQALTGIVVPALVNQVVPAKTVLPRDWTLWAMSLHAGTDDDERLARIEAFLRPRWEALAPQRPAAQRYAEWAQALGMRAATSAPGRSLRQVERRVKAWAGVPMRELRVVSRAERAFMAAAASDDGSTVNWAEIAAETNYADQSHLCRETRRLSGFSPEELRRRMQTEEAFWPYRLWR
jgi:AraC-like DNA-binding protein